MCNQMVTSEIREQFHARFVQILIMIIIIIIIIRIWTKRAWNYSLISLVTICLHILTPFFRSHWPRATGDRGRLTSKSLGSKKSLILGDYRLNTPLTHLTDDQFVSNVGARIYKSANLRCIRAQGAISAITVTRPLVVQRHVVTSDSSWTVLVVSK